MSFYPRFLSAAALSLVALTAFSSPSQAASNGATASNDPVVAMSRRAGLLGANTPFSHVRVIKPPKTLDASHRAFLASIKKSSGGQVRAQQAETRIKFEFKGYTNEQAAVLRNFVTTYYSTLVSVWGDPAPEQIGKVVQVVGNDKNFVATYEPPSAETSNLGGGGTVYFKYDNALSTPATRFNFARLLLLAFWGPRIPAYNYNEASLVEPWVYGMSDAAAVQIVYLASGSPSTFRIADLTQDYLPVYDFLNRPELSNAFIYSPPDANGNPIENDSFIGDFRLSMAQAAFTKVAVENPSFYKTFNSNLYGAGQPRIAVSPDQLKGYAASAVPNVEGMGFRDWVRRQYAIDCTTTTGLKLYAAVIPDPAETGKGDTRPGFNYYVQAFVTNAQGQNPAYTATRYGSIRVYDVNGTDVSNSSKEIQASNVLDFAQVNPSTNRVDYPGEAAGGIGFDALPSGSQQRLSVQFQLASTQTSAFFPLGVAGNRSSAASYYGATTGATSGSVSLQTSTGSQSVPLTLGVFAATQTYGSSSQVQTTITVNGSTFKRNTAWFSPTASNNTNEFPFARSFGFLLDAPATEPNPTPTPGDGFTVTAPAGTDKLRMVTFPFYPKQTDEAAMLGVSSSTLKMARYVPNLAAAQRSGDNLVFGIDTNRHEVYPNISTPVAPGRGYWLETGTGGLSTKVQGEAPPSDQAFEVPLIGGWNQFGVPFNSNFAVGAIQVRYGGFAPVTLDVAEARGWIAPGVWRWLPAGGYERVDSSFSNNLTAYEGYYIFAGPQMGVSLIFQTGTQTPLDAAANGWSIQVLASSSKGRDSANRFGVSSNDSIAKPPTATRRISLRFEGAASTASSASPIAANSGAGFAEAFLGQAVEGTVWTAVVDGTDKKEKVTLSWGSLSSVPSNLQITLRDETTKKKKVLASNGKYNFTSTGVARRFTFTVKVKKKSGKGKSASVTSVDAS